MPEWILFLYLRPTDSVFIQNWVRLKNDSRSYVSPNQKSGKTDVGFLRYKHSKVKYAPIPKYQYVLRTYTGGETQKSVYVHTRDGTAHLEYAYTGRDLRTKVFFRKNDNILSSFIYNWRHWTINYKQSPGTDLLFGIVCRCVRWKTKTSQKSLLWSQKWNLITKTCSVHQNFGRFEKYGFGEQSLQVRKWAKAVVFAMYDTESKTHFGVLLTFLPTVIALLPYLWHGNQTIFFGKQK